VSPPCSHLPSSQAKEPHGIFRLFFAIELWQCSMAGKCKNATASAGRISGRPVNGRQNVDHQFLERAQKLVLICQKIRRTMNGPAKVIIDNSRGNYVLLESEGVVRGVMAKAGGEGLAVGSICRDPRRPIAGQVGTVFGYGRNAKPDSH
jgi:hypothetical protein